MFFEIWHHIKTVDYPVIISIYVEARTLKSLLGWIRVKAYGHAAIKWRKSEYLTKYASIFTFSLS